MTFGVRDVAGDPSIPKKITLSLDDLDFNSGIISNTVLISKENRLKTIYNFCDRHTEEYPGIVFLEVDDEHRLRVYINSERQCELLETILKNAEKIRAKQELAKKAR